MSAPSSTTAAIATLEQIGPLRRDEPMARHTTFGIGGPADLYLKVTSAEALRQAFATARQAGLGVFILGSGSNVLVSDRGIRGLVIENEARSLTGPESIDEQRCRFVVESGASFAALARRLSRDGYTGMEWASGIPGTLGGAVVYNAGAYGSQLADVLIAITVADGTGSTRTLPAAELELAYRSSGFTRGLVRDQVILATTLMLSRGDSAKAVATVAAFDAKRLAAQPRGRNAGSIFKNPPGGSAWQLIDAAGLRGMRRGDAEISAKHTNFFCNIGHATAAEVKALIDLAQQQVRERFGVELQREVQLVGQFD